jgi:arylsulfatase
LECGNAEDFPAAMPSNRREFLMGSRRAFVHGQQHDFLAGNRRQFLKTATAGALLSGYAKAGSAKPNIIVIFADDLGYGDLSCYGSKISTPNLDRMAQEGMRFTHFYSASPVCSPSRAALMTGRYPTRYGIPRVIDPTDTNGLPESETTIAQMLKRAGYATMCVGKWHLGSLPQYLPTNRGFDEYFGIPYSIDMTPRVLMRNTDITEQQCGLENLTQRYTQQAVDFINRSKDSPFFLYMPHSFPHIPCTASRAFLGNSGQGIYGDTIQEIDASVGQVLQAVRDNGLDSNTLVVFSSDHGPWYQGSTNGLRGRKGDTFEGGMRVPFIARYPGSIPAGQVCQSLTNTMDVLPTLAALTSAALPGNSLDGINIWPLLSGQVEDISREAFLYFSDVALEAARLGPWKLHVTRFNSPMFVPEPRTGRLSLPLPRPELYNVVADPDESYDRADRNSATVADIRSRIEKLILTFPADIQNAWFDALSRKVYFTPAGAPPIQVV